MGDFGIFYGKLRAWYIMNNIMNAGHDGMKSWLVRIGPVCAHHEIDTREPRSAPTGLQPSQNDHKRTGSHTSKETSNRMYERSF